MVVGFLEAQVCMLYLTCNVAVSFEWALHLVPPTLAGVCIKAVDKFAPPLLCITISIRQDIPNGVRCATVA
jgi:hypothetical protein